jgi:hypothetical protein
MSTINAQLSGVNTPIDVNLVGAGALADYAKESKQLPDNHNVAVSNFPVHPATFDLYERQRVSQIETIFSANVGYMLPTCQMESIASGTGVAAAFNTNERMADLVVNAGTGNSAMQSYEYIHYQRGTTQFSTNTVIFGAHVANVTMQIGSYDASNGVFLRRDGAGVISFVLRNSSSGAPVDTVVVQASWNLDTFGSLDLTKMQSVVLDLQDGGSVRCGFLRNAEVHYVHQFVLSNSTSDAGMASMDLPARVEVDAAVSGAGATLKWRATSVTREGGTPTDIIGLFSTETSQSVMLGGSRTLAWTIRPKTVGVGGLTSRTTFRIKRINAASDKSKNVLWELVWGANTTPNVFADVNPSSNFEFSKGGTFTDLTGGRVVSSGYCNLENAVDAVVNVSHPCSLNAAGANVTSHTYSLLVTALDGGSPDAWTSLDYLEY